MAAQTREDLETSIPQYFRAMDDVSFIEINSC